MAASRSHVIQTLAFLHVAIQLAIPAVLLQEGVEGGEQLGHGSGSLAEMRARTGGGRRDVDLITPVKRTRGAPALLISHLSDSR
jgi:hypothetical protein